MKRTGRDNKRLGEERRLSLPADCEAMWTLIYDYQICMELR